MATSDTQIDAVRQQLLSDLRRVAKKVESRLRYQAILYWSVATTAVIAGLLVIDCLFQREEIGLRWLSWIVLVSASTFAAFRWLKPLSNLRVLPLDIAQWLERRQPQWSCRISTALELAEMEQPDDRFGSPSFREAALAQWHAQPAKPQWDELIGQRNFKRALAGLSLILLVILLLVAIWPELGLHALKRLFVPWSNERWPRADQLELVNLPPAVGQDSIIQLEVLDRRPPLPDDVTIELRYATSIESVVSIPTQRIGDLAVASLPPILQEIHVRAVGGDDRQMPWQTIRVVEVPGWNQYKFRIQPPDYLRQSPTALSRLTSSTLDSEGIYELIGQRIQVLAGSQVLFMGELSTAIHSLTIQPQLIADKASKSTGSNTPLTNSSLPWDLKLESDQVTVRSFATALRTEKSPGQGPLGFTMLNQSLAWTVRLEIQPGVWLESPNHWKIEVLPDNAPEALIESPQISSLTRGAPLVLKAVARDDWGLQSIAAKLTTSSAPEVEYVLPIQVIPDNSLEQFIKQEWDFAAQLASAGVELKPQEQISVWIEATDLNGQSSKSSVERISLESKQQQLANLAEKKDSLADQIKELLKVQESAQELTQRTTGDWQQQPLAQRHLDALNSVQQLQQSIRQQLADTPQSLQAEIDQLRQIVSENQLGGTQFAEQLLQLQQAVANIGNQSANAAWQRANSLQAQAAQSIETGDTSRLPSLVSELDDSQSQTRTRLQALADQLDDSNIQNRIRQRLLEIANQQQQLNEDTIQLNVNNLQKERPDLNEQLSIASTVQAGLASQTERWLTEVFQLQQLDSSGSMQPLAFQLQEAGRQLVDLQAVEHMRTSSNSLNPSQLGRALQSQELIQQALAAALGKIGEQESSELLDSLATQEQRLSALRDRAQELSRQQSLLADKFSDPQASSRALALAGEQEENERASSQLLTAMEPDDSLRDTIRQSVQFQQQAATAAADTAMSAAAEAATQAAQKLDEVASQLSHRANRANQQVLLQQLYELTSALGLLVSNQQDIMPQYEQLAQQSLNLTADMAAQANLLVRDQSAVRESLRKLLPRALQLPAFHWVLQQSESDFTRAIVAIERNRIAPDAISAAQSGLRKLMLASDSLANNQDIVDATQTNPEQGPQGDDQPSKDAGSLPPLVSLKLLHSLQIELKEQTAGLENDLNRGTKISELARQQEELGELLEQLITEAQAALEQDR